MDEKTIAVVDPMTQRPTDFQRVLTDDTGTVRALVDGCRIEEATFVLFYDVRAPVRPRGGTLTQRGSEETTERTDFQIDPRYGQAVATALNSGGGEKGLVVGLVRDLEWKKSTPRVEDFRDGKEFYAASTDSLGERMETAMRSMMEGRPNPHSPAAEYPAILDAIVQRSGAVPPTAWVPGTVDPASLLEAVQWMTPPAFRAASPPTPDCLMVPPSHLYERPHAYTAGKPPTLDWEVGQTWLSSSTSRTTSPTGAPALLPISGDLATARQAATDAHEFRAHQELARASLQQAAERANTYGQFPVELEAEMRKVPWDEREERWPEEHRSRDERERYVRDFYGGYGHINTWIQAFGDLPPTSIEAFRKMDPGPRRRRDDLMIAWDRYHTEDPRFITSFAAADCNPPGRTSRIIEAHDMNTGDSVIDRLGARYHRKGGAGRVAFFVSPRADSADLAADFTAAATVGSSSHVVFRCDYAPAAGPMARAALAASEGGNRFVEINLPAEVPEAALADVERLRARQEQVGDVWMKIVQPEPPAVPEPSSKRLLARLSGLREGLRAKGVRRSRQG